MFYRTFRVCFPFFACCSYLLLGFACSSESVSAPKTPDVPIAAAIVSEALPLPIDTQVLLGKFVPAEHPDFEAVKAPYTDRPDMWMQREALAAYRRLYEAAKKDGIDLKIISSTRTFAQQKAIWEAKWQRFAKEAPVADTRALKILEYSSMPGTSRHHWGTDIDLNDLNNPAFESGGRYAKVYEWLVDHAHEYGFCQPYSAKGAERPQGYNEERWHWSYTPLSKPFLQQYRENFTDTDIQGFQGSETARSLQVVQNYVSGIRASCAP